MAKDKNFERKLGDGTILKLVEGTRGYYMLEASNGIRKLYRGYRRYHVGGGHLFYFRHLTPELSATIKNS